jgi:hypothetical protein
MTALIEIAQLCVATVASFALALLLGRLAATGLLRLMPRLLPVHALEVTVPEIERRPHLVHPQRKPRRVLQVIRGGQARM